MPTDVEFKTELVLKPVAFGELNLMAMIEDGRETTVALTGSVEVCVIQ